MIRGLVVMGMVALLIVSALVYLVNQKYPTGFGSNFVLKIRWIVPVSAGLLVYSLIPNVFIALITIIILGLVIS